MAFTKFEFKFQNLLIKAILYYSILIYCDSDYYLIK